MPVDPVLALFGDRLFMAAVGVYVLAMALHAAEAAARTRRPEAAAVTVPARAASGGAGPEAPPDGPGRRTRAHRLGRMGVSLTVLAVLLHLGSIVARGLAVDRWPRGRSPR